MARRTAYSYGSFTGREPTIYFLEHSDGTRSVPIYSYSEAKKKLSFVKNVAGQKGTKLVKVVSIRGNY